MPRLIYVRHLGLRYEIKEAAVTAVSFLALCGFKSDGSACALNFNFRAPDGGEAHCSRAVAKSAEPS